MPQYGTFRYGRIGKYGRYRLATPDGRAIGPHIVYRIRAINKDSERSDFIAVNRERISIPNTKAEKIRVRINKNEWTYTQNEIIDGDIYRVRIRSLESDGGITDWVYGERANLRLI